MKSIEISIAIVKNSDDLFLICLRPEHVHQGGKWEFPGGKVEQNEAAEQAMLRELQEEVAITASRYSLFESKFFDYGDKQLSLHFFLVDEFSGQAIGKEGQPIKWVNKEQLKQYPFPEANMSIIEKL